MLSLRAEVQLAFLTHTHTHTEKEIRQEVVKKIFIYIFKKEKN